jgi:hypothetical protein
MSNEADIRHTGGAAPGRRGLLRGASFGAAAFGALALGVGGSKSAAAEEETQINDLDILNFALNLEYLEAEFYLRATTGQGIPPQDVQGIGNQGSVTGGSQVPFRNPLVAELAREIANDEFKHVLFLRRELGSAAIAEPSINLSTSFTALGQAAGFVGQGGTFNPFSSDDNFLLGGFIFEDVGVTAYHGAAPLLKSKAYLAAAAGILAVEAYHASELRLQLLQVGDITRANLISKLRAELSGAHDDQGIYANGKPNIVPATEYAIAYSRTTTQVLDVVYGGGAQSNYLFFPNKVNGAIQ